MRALFLIERDGYYKFLGPVIDEFLSRGDEIYLLHLYENYHALYSAKGRNFPNLSKLPRFQNEARGKLSYALCRSNEELPRFVGKNAIDCVVAIHGQTHCRVNIDIPWFCLQHGFDTIHEINRKRLTDCTALFIYNRGWLKYVKKPDKINFPVIECGHYHLELPLMDEEGIRFKYGIPPKKPVLLYIPLARTHDAYFSGWKKRFFQFYYLKKENATLAKIKKYCDDEGTFFMIKARFKSLMEEDFPFNANVIYDETFYPSTMYELQKIASLVIAPCYTTGLMEAIFFNKRCLKIKYNFIDDTLASLSKGLLGEEDFNILFHTKGVVAHCEYKNFNENFIKEEISKGGNHDNHEKVKEIFSYPSSGEKKGFNKIIVDNIKKIVGEKRR